jgi:hypothetical protein
MSRSSPSGDAQKGTVSDSKPIFAHLKSRGGSVRRMRLRPIGLCSAGQLAEAHGHQFRIVTHQDRKRQEIAVKAFISRIVPVLLLAGFSGNAMAAPASTPSGNITRLSGGWVNANLRVITDFAWTNPENCTYTDGYMVDPADSGHELLSSILLSASMSRRRIQLTVDGCSQGRPRIIGVDIVD